MFRTVNYEDFAHDNIDISEKKVLRQKLEIPDGSFVITSVGELSKRKNQEIIIKALKRLDNKRIYYVIAGIGEEENRLKQLTMEFKMADNVKFIGYRTDLHEIYSISDVAAYPSKMEGLMVSGMEAMASGVPLLYSNVRGIKDYSINGVTGLAIDPCDVRSVTEKISELYSMTGKLKNNMAHSAKSQVEKYDSKYIDDRMRVLYSDFSKKH